MLCVTPIHISSFSITNLTKRYFALHSAIYVSSMYNDNYWCFQIGYFQSTSFHCTSTVAEEGIERELERETGAERVETRHTFTPVRNHVETDENLATIVPLTDGGIPNRVTQIRRARRPTTL